MKSIQNEDVNSLRYHARSVVRELGLLNDAFHEIGVTLAERHLLIELNSGILPTMGEIAARLLLDKSTVSRLIAKAVKKKYIKCIPDKIDKRKRFLQLTEKGREVLHAFEPIAFNQTKSALLTLSHEEIKIVYQGVALYAQGLRNARLNENREQVRETKTEVLERLKILGFRLEPYDASDEEALYQIFQAVVDSGTQFPYENSSCEEFQRQFFSQGGKVYVCRSDAGEVIGGFYLRANYSGRSSHIANAAYMIREQDRGKGLGTLLIKASLHLAKEQGFRAMEFNMVLSQNKAAVKLYEKLGFSLISTIPDAVRNPDGTFQDGYVMHRSLDNL